MKRETLPLPIQLLLLAPLLLFLLGNGCEPSTPRDPEITPVSLQDSGGVEVSRFSVSHVGSFNAGYSNAKRDILLVRDNQTGAEYLAITDCSIMKIVEAEEAVANAAEIAVDAATSIGSQ